MKTTDKSKIVYEIKIPGETIIIGPGTVPTSGASIAHTSISEMTSGLRKASREGLFESNTYGSNSQPSK